PDVPLTPTRALELDDAVRKRANGHGGPDAAPVTGREIDRVRDRRLRVHQLNRLHLDRRVVAALAETLREGLEGGNHDDLRPVGEGGGVGIALDAGAFLIFGCFRLRSLNRVENLVELS